MLKNEINIEKEKGQLNKDKNNELMTKKKVEENNKIIKKNKDEEIENKMKKLKMIVIKQ